MKSGDRDLNFIGDENTYLGLFSVEGTEGAQNVQVGVNNELNVTGDAFISLGSGNDVVDENNKDITVGGDMTMNGVNLFDSQGAVNIAGNLGLNLVGESDGAIFDDNRSLNIGGDFSYVGSDGDDQVSLDGWAGTVIGGNASINLGGNTSLASQSATLGPLASIGGSLTVTSTGSTGTDTFTSATAPVLAVTFSSDLVAEPMLQLSLVTSLETQSNTTVVPGVDEVTVGTTGTAADLNIKMSSNDDTFTLKSTTAVNSLRADFGGGNDTFVNEYGNYDFEAKLLDLQGFDRFYDFANDSLRTGSNG